MTTAQIHNRLFLLETLIDGVERGDGDARKIGEKLLAETIAAMPKDGLVGMLMSEADRLNELLSPAT